MKVKLKLFFKWGIEFEEKYEVMENGNREVHYANRSELFNNIIQTYSPQYLEPPVTDSKFDEVSGEKKKKNENLKTSPKSEESAPQEKSTENKNTKKKTAPIRTERPTQEVLDNE